MLCNRVCRGCCNGESSHRKDSAWAWIVCFAAATNLAFSSGLVYSFGVLLPVFMDYFEESRETTGRLLNCETTPGTACEYTDAFNTHPACAVRCHYVTNKQVQQEWCKQCVRIYMRADIKHFNIQLSGDSFRKLWTLPSPPVDSVSDIIIFVLWVYDIFMCDVYVPSIGTWKALCMNQSRSIMPVLPLTPT